MCGGGGHMGLLCFSIVSRYRDQNDETAAPFLIDSKLGLSLVNLLNLLVNELK